MDADEAARVRRGASASTSPDVLQALAKDPSVTVRASVALNPALPNHLTAVLAADADARVRAIIGRKLASLAPDLTEAARERAQQNAMANLTTPVADAALRVRANVAESVLMLFSPMLTQEDLVALIASGPPSTTLTAVARRSKISEAVSDALVETADVAAIGALLANHTAQIREVTLDALAAQSEEQTAWQEPLVRRPYLSAAGRAHPVGDRHQPPAGDTGGADRSRSQAEPGVAHPAEPDAAEGAAGDVRAAGGASAEYDAAGRAVACLCAARCRAAG